MKLFYANVPRVFYLKKTALTPLVANLHVSSGKKTDSLVIDHSKCMLRPLKPDELKTVSTNLAKKEGWNPGRHEYLPFYMANPKGHNGLFSNQQLIASLSAVRYSKDFAFLGLYIVTPGYRNKGIGQVLVTATLEALADCPLLGINAVQTQVENYQRKYGFVPQQTHSRWVGRYTFHKNMIEPAMGIKIVDHKNIDFNDLLDYDASIFSCSREAFLRNWVEMPDAKVLVALENGKICGYAVQSQCFQGCKLAPLFADTENIAKQLYAAFAHLSKNALMQIDIPDNNQAAVKLVVQSGLRQTFRTVRMYKGKPELNHEKNSNIFGLTTLEIG